MILLDDQESPVLTANFQKLLVAYRQAIARREVIGVVGPAGVGFKYTLKQFAQKHYLKVIYCSIKETESVQRVLVELCKHLCNVRFSNLNYRNTTLFNLVYVLNHRLKVGDSCLLCIDHCSNLTPKKLMYFAQFLNDFDKPIGLVFRISSRYAKKISGGKNYIEAFEKLDKAVDNWRVLDHCTDDEVRTIASRHSEDHMLISDLVKSSRGNLSILAKHLSRLNAFNAEKGLSAT